MALVADDGLARHPHAVDGYLVRGRAALARLFLVGADLEALGMPVYHEAGDALRRPGVETELGRDAAVRDPHLGAREAVVFVYRAGIGSADLADVVEFADCAPIKV